MKKNVFLICDIALYPRRAGTLSYMYYRYVPLMNNFEQFWSEKGYRFWIQESMVFKETMRAHKLIWLFSSEWIRTFSSNTTIKKMLEKYVDFTWTRWVGNLSISLKMGMENSMSWFEIGSTCEKLVGIYLVSVIANFWGNCFNCSN